MGMGIYMLEIIRRIREYQDNSMVHPLTCGNNSNHANLEPVIINGKVALMCLNCDYIQKHIPCYFLEKTDEMD